MARRPVQISLDVELLKRIDRDPEARKKGRFAFIRSAVEFYLRTRERAEVDEAIQSAYRGQGEALLKEVDDLFEAQEWPADQRAETFGCCIGLRQVLETATVVAITSTLRGAPTEVTLPVPTWRTSSPCGRASFGSSWDGEP